MEKLKDKNKVEIPRGKMFGGGGHRKLSNPVEKANDFKGASLKIIRYSKAFIPLIVFSILVSIAASVLQIIGPNKLKDLSNEIEKALPSADILSAVDIPAVSKIAYFLLTIYLLAIFLNIFQSFIMAGVTQRISKKMRADIIKKINKLEFKYFDKTSYGDMLSRLSNDVDTVSQAVDEGLNTLITSLTMLIGVLIMMVYNSWILALVALVFSFLGTFLMRFIIKKSHRYFKERQAGLGAINGQIEEVFSNHQTVKLYSAFDEIKKDFDKTNYDLYYSSWKSHFLSGIMMPMMHFIGNISYVAVSIVGAVLAMKGTISFGVIVAFMIYIRLFTQPLSRIAQSSNSLQQAAAAGERVFEVLEEEEMEDESFKDDFSKKSKGDIEFKNINFSYNPGEEIIKNFSLKVEPGQKIAIVGPTGAGKTTLVNLLMRFYEIDSGDILLDGVSIKLMKREDVHRQFAMVLQNSWIFEGSVRDNIIFNKEGVSDKELIEACKAVGLHRFIESLPESYNTILDDNSSLSEGQKQLLSIARAMIQDAPLLILDEATSSVDTRTEKIVQSAMDNLMKGRTSFVIAHRLSTIKNADLILVVRDGMVVERGNHKELLDNNSFYSELYKSQFEAEIN